MAIINIRSSRHGFLLAGALLLLGCQSSLPTYSWPVVEQEPDAASVLAKLAPVVVPYPVIDPPPLVHSSDPFSTDLPDQDAITSEYLYEQAKALMAGTPSQSNKELAARLLNQSAELGNAEALRVLGLLMLKEGPEQQALAIALLERSAINSVRAMRQLGILYGNLSDKHLSNPAKAIKYLSIASAIGDGESSFYLGKLMKRAGRDDESERLSALATDQGYNRNPTKKMSVAVKTPVNDMHAYGLQRQALRGNLESMYEYGHLVMNRQVQGILLGQEHSADFEAFYWFKRASLMGDQRSAAQVIQMAYIEDLMGNSGMTYEKLNELIAGNR